MNNLINIGMQNNLTYRFQKHVHKYWEITYYFEGSGKNITENRDIYFQKGTIVCQPPGMIHEDITETGYKNIYFCVENFALAQPTPLILNDTPNSDFLYILRQLYYEFYYRPTHKLVTNAILNVLQQYMFILANDSAKSNFYVECFKRELVNNLSNCFFNVADALESVPLCKDHFRRLFKADTGTTPVEYLNRIRINYAKELLENSTLSVKNIAQMCGFDDQYYFSRVFKKQTGESPKLWKRDMN